MINYLKRMTNNIMNLGITDELSPEKVLRFRLVNIITYLSLITDFVFILIGIFFIKLNSFALGLGVTFMMLLGVLVLMNYKKYNSARILAIFACVTGGLVT